MLYRMGVIDEKKIQREVKAGSRAIEYSLKFLFCRYIRPSTLELAKATPRNRHISGSALEVLQACKPVPSPCMVKLLDIFLNKSVRGNPANRGFFYPSAYYGPKGENIIKSAMVPRAKHSFHHYWIHHYKQQNTFITSRELKCHAPTPS